MQNKNFIFKLPSVLLFAAVLFAISVLTPSISKAYTYNGYKWSSYPVSIDTGDPSFPVSWISPFAAAMSAWNAASSPFYFNSGSAGHQVKCANNGNNGVLAVTSISWSGSQISDCDITFNTYYPWSTSGGASAYDVQNVATHELGHWLSLADLYGGGDTEKTMYYSAGVGETKKRTLETDDLNGINAIYP